MKAGVALQASIVWENLWVAPEVTWALSDIADKVPNLLEVSSDIPWVWTLYSWLLWKVPFLDELSNDVSNMLNIWIYMSTLWLIYLIAKYSWGKKWKLEAFWSSVVWTAIAAGLFSEFYQYLQWNGGDILGYLPKKNFEAMPEWLESFLNEETRKTIQWVSSAVLSLLSWTQALKNIDIMRWKGKNRTRDSLEREWSVNPK